MRRIILATANLPVSIPRGDGRRFVTLYEALIRSLATGKVYRRAAVMTFIRSAQAAAACPPDPFAAATPPVPARLQDHLDRLLAAGAGIEEVQQVAGRFFEALRDEMKQRSCR